MQSIGIFSGTFNPVHNGHIAFAREALTICSLDRVVFLPEQSPRGKINLPDVQVRAAHLRQAIAEWPDLDVLALDQIRFTVSDTLPELHRQFNNAKFTLLLGSDVASGLANWPNLTELAAEAAFAIGLRKNDTVEVFEEVRQQVESAVGTSVKMTCVKTDYSHLSSSQFR